MKIMANAKLNLMLRIVGKKQNGYHLLQMINVPISLYDELDVKIEQSNETKIKQIFSVPLDCPLEKTTIYKSFMFLKRYITDPHKIIVNVKKNIPMGSGMGGGSSDAAFFIKKLCQRFHTKITDGMLSEIANEVGADVPFFIYNKPAFVEGIGEKISTFKSFPQLYFVVVTPDFTISTKWAYENVKMPLTKENDDIIIKNSKMDLELLLQLMENDLEKPVKERYPVITEIKESLRANGALKAMMTGSGSAVFGVFDNVRCWETAFKRVRDKFKLYNVLKCDTIGV